MGARATSWTGHAEVTELAARAAASASDEAEEWL